MHLDFVTSATSSLCRRGDTLQWGRGHGYACVEHPRASSHQLGGRIRRHCRCRSRRMRNQSSRPRNHQLRLSVGGRCSILYRWLDLGKLYGEKGRENVPLLLFLPRPSLSTTSSAHCILLSLLSPGLLIAPRSLSTGCWCRVDGE